MIKDFDRCNLYNRLPPVVIVSDVDCIVSTANCESSAGGS